MVIICTEKCEFYDKCKQEPIACADLAHAEGVMEEYIPAPRWPNRVYYHLLQTGRTYGDGPTRERGAVRAKFEKYKDRIMEMVFEGISYNEIGDRFGIKPNTLSDIVRKELYARNPEFYTRIRQKGGGVTRRMLIENRDKFQETKRRPK
jgi:hypothetical protein